MLKELLRSSLILLLVACGGDDEPQEIIDKLRGLGMAFSPVVSSPSNGPDLKSIVVTVYAAIPKGKPVSIEKYSDQVSSSPQFQLRIEDYDITKIEKPVTYAGFDLIQFQAKLKVPDITMVPAGGFVHFGFLLKADSNQEKMVGSFLVLAKDADRWKAPLLKIVKPIEAASLKTNDDSIPISFDLTNNNDEELKIAWFTSGGKISNRRAQNTFWESPSAPGDYTLIATVRGRKSRAFAIDIRTVHIN